MLDDITKEEGVELITVTCDYAALRQRMQRELDHNVTRVCERVSKPTDRKLHDRYQKRLEQAHERAMVARSVICPISLILEACETVRDVQELKQKLREQADRLVEYTDRLAEEIDE